MLAYRANSVTLTCFLFTQKMDSLRLTDWTPPSSITQKDRLSYISIAMTT